MQTKQLFYLVADDRYFCSHRLPLAIAAKKQGYEVTVLTTIGDCQDKIERAGIRVVPINFQRGGVNPFVELKTLWQILLAYRKYRPDIVHHIAIKPVLYGTLCALLTRIPNIINAISGLGYVFTQNHLKALLVRYPMQLAFRLLLNRSSVKTIVQNQDDQQQLSAFINPKRILLIPGAGVNPDLFSPTEEPTTPPIKVVLVARMLWTKGVGELIEAARLLHKENIQIQLVGDPDEQNPASIPIQALKQWDKEGIITWQGYQSNIAKIYQESHIAILPSYREGLPKSLLEAAACGRPIITCDVPGCREIVKDGYNGILVPMKDSISLVKAIQTLASDKTIRLTMGANGRKRIETEFSEQIINTQVLALY